LQQRFAGLEARDTAGFESCATQAKPSQLLPSKWQFQIGVFSSVAEVLLSKDKTYEC
jgi:hypothetical protein